MITAAINITITTVTSTITNTPTIIPNKRTIKAMNTDLINIAPSYNNLRWYASMYS